MLRVKRSWLIHCVFVLDKKKLFAHLSFSFHIKAMDFLESFLKNTSEGVCLFN